MRGQVVASTPGVDGTGIMGRLAQLADVANQQVNLLLLADDDLVELLQQVFAKAGLDFQIGQALVNVLRWMHSLIGHEFAAQAARTTRHPACRWNWRTDQWLASYTGLRLIPLSGPPNRRDTDAPESTTGRITMSILGNILGKIFPSFRSAEAATPPSPTNEEASAAAAAAGAARAANATPSPAAMEQVDVEALLDGLAQKNTQKLNWKTSIVDLMKLLDLDSSLSERKELAKELGYTQDTSDSAAMNIWLHRQVMNKLAANGGKVPSELKD